MDSVILAGLVDELEKLGEVFGRSNPDDTLSETEVPLHLKKKVLMDYVRDKSKEEPSGLGNSLLAGGLTGAGLGGIMGGLASRSLGGAAAGLIGGGLPGAGTGALLRASDKNEIETLRGINPKDNDQVDRFMTQRIVSARRAKERSQEMRKDTRNAQLVRAINNRRPEPQPTRRVTIYRY